MTDNMALTMSMFANRRDYNRAQAQRDLNPHKPARAAMFLWSAVYAKSGLGGMGFWDSLTDQQKRYCRDCVAGILAARDEAP
jgi:hypothetical protein